MPALLFNTGRVIISYQVAIYSISVTFLHSAKQAKTLTVCVKKSQCTPF